uniref:RNA-directed DNA polymerase, eukaryota n=1 Tax=Tanacetum cinerariifolium TaxID=118510 RepID=A0A699GNJ8_TANCI|nr:RNA-directed DNA polymerase, eukaryota [Tanacetum cinerariifolium]
MFRRRKNVSSKRRNVFVEEKIMLPSKRKNVMSKRKNVFVEEKTMFLSKRKNVSSKKKNISSKKKKVFVEEKRMLLSKRKNVLSKRKNAWADVVDRVSSRLSKWKMNMLSIGGRLTLLKSVLGSMPIFHISIFKAPLGVLRKLELIRIHFFNGLLQIVTKPHGVIKAIYGETRSVDGNVNFGFKTCWMNIVQEVNTLVGKGIDLQKFICFKLGNEEKARFLDDRWLDGEFYVAWVRRLIDDKTLPDAAQKTRWVRYMPIKVNVIAWKVKSNSLPTRFNISRRVRLIARWWDVPYVGVESYADWVSWMENLRLWFKNKLMLEGVFYVLWWYVWTFHTKMIFDTKIPMKATLFDDIVIKSYFWVRYRVNEEESFDPIVQTPSQNENTNDDDDSHDVNIDQEGRDIQMADVQTTQEIEDTHVTLTPVNPEDVSVTTTAEPPLLSATTLHLPSTPIIPHLQQTPVTSPENVLSSSLQDLPNFGSLFRFDHRLKTLEVNFSEFMQTNQFVEAISSIPGIVDKYMDNRMNEAVKVAVQLQSDRLRYEAQAKNEDFLNKLDENIQKIIKEQVKEQVKVQVSKILPKIKKTVNEQLEAEVLTHSFNSSKTSYVVAANISELGLKKIFIDKMESNKSIHRSDEQKNLYKALVDTYECDKIILDTYGDTVTLKRRRDDEDIDEEPSAGSNRGSKRRRAGKEQESTSAPKEKYLRDNWQNKTFPTNHGPIQPWISNLARKYDSRTSFNELMDTHLDFSAFVMNRFKVDNLTPELLASPTYELMKGSCKSLVKLEFFLEEVYKTTTDQLDWNNPEGQQYPHDLRKPLPLIPTSRGRRVIPFDHFINNDLEYLRGSVLSRKYTTSVTKTKAADYWHIKWIEDLVPRTMESARDVYSKRRIIAVTELQIVEWHNYKHLDWITVRRDDDKLYKFKEGDYNRLHIQDIKDSDET